MKFLAEILIKKTSEEENIMKFLNSDFYDFYKNLLDELDSNDLNKSKIWFYIILFVVFVWLFNAYRICRLLGQLFFKMIKRKLRKERSEEIPWYENRNLCCICIAEIKDTVFLPCKHLCVCYGCYETMRNYFHRKCPICRQMVKKHIQVYI